jgi:hypothetical protein
VAAVVGERREIKTFETQSSEAAKNAYWSEKGQNRGTTEHTEYTEDEP